VLLPTLEGLPKNGGADTPSIIDLRVPKIALFR